MANRLRSTVHRLLEKPRTAKTAFTMSRRIAATLLIASLGAAMAVLPTTAAAAAACSVQTFRVFPGSYPSGLRYAEVNFQLIGCSDQAPSAWSATVTKAQVNATGQNFGFFINSTTIPTDSITSYSRWWTGRIYASSCTPRIGWPCSRSYSFSVRLQGNYDRYGNVQFSMGARTAPSGMALYTTP